MAFQQKTNREIFYSELNPDTQDSIKKTYLNKFSVMEDELQEVYPYSIPSKSKDRLMKEGLDLPLFAVENHSHPASKTIENFILYKFFPIFVNRFKSVCVTSMKTKKRAFISFKLSESARVEIFNKVIVPKDKWRYKDSELRSLPTPSVKDLNIFMHDEIHYWKPQQLIDFLVMREPKNMLCTLVYPIEIACGVKTSLNPELYQFRVNADSFTFYPDGVLSEGYTQSLNSGWLLGTKRIRPTEGSELVYSVEVIKSIGAHHVVHISKGECDSYSTFRDFGGFSHVPLSSLSHGLSDLDLDSRSISYLIMKKVIAYLMTLKKPDPQSAVAKLRQLVDDSFSISEILFVRQLENEISKQGFEGIFNVGWVNWFKRKVKDLVDPVVEKFFGVNFYRGLTDDLFKSESFSIRLSLDSVKPGTKVGGMLERLFNVVEPEWENVNFMEKFMNRERRFYSLNGGEVACQVERISDGLPVAVEISQRRFEFLEQIHSSIGIQGWSVVRRGVKVIQQPEVVGGLETDVSQVIGETKRTLLIEWYPKSEGDLIPKASVGVNNKLMCEENERENLSIPLIRRNSRSSKGKEVSRSFDQTSTSGSSKVIAEVNDFDGKSNSCFIKAMMENLKCSFKQLVSEGSKLAELYRDDKMVSLSDMGVISDENSISFRVVSEAGIHTFSPKLSSEQKNGEVNLIVRDAGDLILSNCHFFSSSVLHRSRRNDNSLIEYGSFSSYRFVINGVNSEKFSSEYISCYHMNVKDVDSKAAFMLFRSFVNGSTGVILDGPFNDGWSMIPGIKKEDTISRVKLMKSFNLNTLDAINKHHSGGDLRIGVTSLLGVAGCGKSKTLIEKLRELGESNSHRSIFITPRDALKREIIEKTGEWSKNCVKTFERALLCDFSKVDLVILDELNLYPRGYTDLIALKWVSQRLSLGLSMEGCGMIMMGDPMQAEYHKRADSTNLSEGSEMDRLFSIIPKPNYRYLSFRLGANQCNKFGFGSGLNSNDGKKSEGWRFQDQVFSDMTSASLICGFGNEKSEMDYVVLIPSELDNLSGRIDSKVMTYGQSQGINVDYAMIGLSRRGQLASDAQILVALTRAKRGFCFFLMDSPNLKTYLRGCKSGVLSRYLIKDFLSLSKYVRFSVEGMVKINSRSGGGLISEEEMRPIDNMEIHQSERDVELKTEGDPWLRGLMFIGQDEGLIRESKIEAEVEPECLKTHVPIVEKGNFALRLDKIRARETREFRDKGGWSKQFTEEKAWNCKNLFLDLPQCSMVRSIYPRHFSDDDLTFKKAVEKRLRFSNYFKEYRKFESAKPVGKAIFDRFNEVMKIPEFRSNSMYEEAQREFESVKLSKNQATITNHSGRSDPDWPWNKVIIFMKAQLCSKFEKRFSDAKAGQTLACFSHETLCKFNAWCRYTEKVIAKFCPRNFYIHQRKNFDELNRFIRRHYNGSSCIESDYEAFDASQDANILQFEVHLMKRIGWPSDVIDSYIAMKLSLTSKLGNFAIMRFTGEFCTFLFNTLANMAFTFMRYNIKGNEPICFAGDDMCCLRNVRETNKYSRILSKMSLKAKVCRTEQPTFCGWVLTRFGIVKKPELILERLIAASEIGHLDMVMDSYFLELSYGYRLGEHLNQIFCESELADHYQLVRFFVQNKEKLKGSSLSIIQNLLYLSDDE